MWYQNGDICSIRGKKWADIYTQSWPLSDLAKQNRYFCCETYLFPLRLNCQTPQSGWKRPYFSSFVFLHYSQWLAGSAVVNSSSPRHSRSIMWIWKQQQQCLNPKHPNVELQMYKLSFSGWVWTLPSRPSVATLWKVLVGAHVKQMLLFHFGAFSPPSF